MSEKLDLLPLVEAIERVTSRRIHLSTCLRWTQKGRRGQRLRSWVLGARRMTTEQAVRDFIAATTEVSEPRAAAPVGRPSKPGARQKQIERASLLLEKAGI